MNAKNNVQDCKNKLLHREFRKKIPTHPYLVRRDAAHHVVRAIQGVGQGVFVRCLVQLLNNACRRKYF